MALPKPAASDRLVGLRRSSAQRLTSGQGRDTGQGCCLVGAGVAKALFPRRRLRACRHVSRDATRPERLVPLSWPSSCLAV
jgi:hypothetical protein